MSVQSWLVLLLIYVGNLFLGAFLFHAAECPGELEDKVEQEKQEMQDIYITRYLGKKGKVHLEVNMDI